MHTILELNPTSDLEENHVFFLFGAAIEKEAPTAVTTCTECTFNLTEFVSKIVQVNDT